MEITVQNITVLEAQQNQTIKETVQRERSRLLSFIRRRMPTEEDAEDVLQDVLYELTNMTRMLRPIEQASAWLFRVARNKITDRSRKKKTELLEDSLLFSSDSEGDDGPLLLADILPAMGATPDALLLRHTIFEALDAALEELPVEQKEVFVQHELEGKSFKEIAVETGLSQNTLLSRKRYAVLFLRERLQGLYEDLFSE
ncbi:MAG: sigma-70 family RNA polymerase sigma factor [Lewinellaceae bacterium]|nr:sigma-70 family RNA polymerase sigma factor [Lewinellaceae bacterium]